MKEGGEGEEVRQQVLRACAGEHLISCEGQGNNVNLRRRKCFHEKGLVRQDSIRLFGKDFNSPLQGVAAEEGRRERPTSSRLQISMTVWLFCRTTLRKPACSWLRSCPQNSARRLQLAQ
jgi:hypothetical protein